MGAIAATGTSEDGKIRWPVLGDYIEAYESALASKQEADVAEFAPPANHPDQLAILCEMVRVDLEYQWERGRQVHLEHYRDRFPALFEDPEHVRAMVYEEHRQRQRAGDTPAPADYQNRFGVDSDSWPSPPVTTKLDQWASKFDSTPLAGSPAESTSGVERAASVYRLYRRQGEGRGDLASLLKSYQVAAEPAEFLNDLDRTDTHAAERLRRHSQSSREWASDFWGFDCAASSDAAHLAEFFSRGRAIWPIGWWRSKSRPTSPANLWPWHSSNTPMWFRSIRCTEADHTSGPVCMPYLGA